MKNSFYLSSSIFKNRNLNLCFSFLLVFSSILPSVVTAQQSKTEPATNFTERICQSLKNIEVQGFRLGMTTNEILKKLSLTKDEIAVIKAINAKDREIPSTNDLLIPLVYTGKDEKGYPLEVEVGHSKLFYPNSFNRYKGIRNIMFKIYQDKVYDIGITYDGTIKWADIKEYVEALNKSFNLPQEAWKIESMGSEEQKMDEAYINLCEDIGLSVYLNKKKPSIYNSNLTPDGFEKDRFTGEPVYYEQFLVLTNELTKNSIEESAALLIEKELKRRKDEEEKRLNKKKKVFKP